MKVAGLFAGIGGIEYGFRQMHDESLFFSEILNEAQIVLGDKFSNCEINNDVRNIEGLHGFNVITAGFPCQDLSIAGKKRGLGGANSSLLYEIFRILLDPSTTQPDYFVIENVKNLLSLNNGEVVSAITKFFSEIGYNWAYRIVDPRSFGIPHRRPRFIFVASKVIHPKYILFSNNEDANAVIDDKINLTVSPDSYGFYWTEGKIGIGWALNSVPPIKGGSSIGIPSPPAIWDIKNDFFGTPTINDAERLQGFPAGWTEIIETNGFKKNHRWKLIGNAVNTKVAEWIASRIMNPDFSELHSNKFSPWNSKRWPKAAFNEDAQIYEVKCSFYPNGINYTPILDFLNEPLIPLSERASRGFCKRVKESILIKYPQDFIISLEKYIEENYSHD